MKTKNKFHTPEIENETIEELSMKLLKANEQLKAEQKKRTEMRFLRINQAWLMAITLPRSE